MSKGRIAIACAACVMLIAPAAAAASLYAAPGATGACTLASPCSVKAAIAAAKAGDEVVLLDGTYSETLVVNKGGAAGQPLRVRADKPHGAVVKVPGAGLGRIEASYVELSGIVFDGDKTGGNGGALDIGAAALATPVHHVLVDDVVVKNTRAAGIMITKGERDVEVRNSRVESTGHHEFWGECFYIGDKTDPALTVYDLEIHHNVLVSCTENAIETKRYSRNVAIHHNEISGQRLGVGKGTDGGQTGNEGTIAIDGVKNSVFSNVLHGNLGGTSVLVVQRSAEHHIYDNVVYDVLAPTASAVKMINWGSEPYGGPFGPSEVYNNTFFALPAPTLSSVDGGKLVVRNNIGLEAADNLVPSKTLAADFVDASSGDFRLKPSSPAIDQALKQPFAPVDFDGSPVVGSARDLGAFEYDPNPKPDAGADAGSDAGSTGGSTGAAGSGATGGVTGGASGADASSGGGSSESGPGDDSGCGCRVRARSSSGAWGVLLVALIGATRRRSRRRAVVASSGLALLGVLASCSASDAPESAGSGGASVGGAGGTNSGGSDASTLGGSAGNPAGGSSGTGASGGGTGGGSGGSTGGGAGQPADAAPDSACAPVTAAPDVDPWAMRAKAAGFGGIETKSAGGHTDVFLKSPTDYIRLGVRLDWGGTVVFYGLSANTGSNVIDANDTGRELQLAIYDPTRSRQPCAWNASCVTSTANCGNSITFLGWNPVQGGDECNHGAKVLSHGQVGEALEVLVQPLQWNPDWDKQDCTQSACGASGVPVQVQYRSRYRFLSEHVVEVESQVTSQESISHPATGQEFPTLYVANGQGGPDLPLLLDAAGTTVTLSTPGNDGFFYDNFASPGPWVSWQNSAKSYGVGLGMDQGSKKWQGWRGGPPSAPYFHNVRAEIVFGLPAGGTVRGLAYLALGGFSTVKGELEAAFKKRPPFGTLDSPKAGAPALSPGTPLAVSGWVLDTAKIANVKVQVDGIEVATLPVGGDRADVCAVYPGYDGCPKVGFAGSVPTIGLTPCPHLLRVVATDADGNSQPLSERVFSLGP